MPRHPPCALTNLPHKPPTHTTNPCTAGPCPAHNHVQKIDLRHKQSTIYNTTNKKHTTSTTPNPLQGQEIDSSVFCSRPLSNNQTTRNQPEAGTPTPAHGSS